jgi:chemotaxis protein MotB
MARRKKHAGHVNHERWLVSYADFITLLFAFFVVLFAASQVDKGKVGKIAHAVQTAFQELSIFPLSAPTAPLVDANEMLYPDPRERANIQARMQAGSLIPPIRPTTPSLAPRAWMDDLEKSLGRELSAELDLGDVMLARRDEGVVITLLDTIYFAQGSAILGDEGRSLLGRIARALAPAPVSIRVDGHTDAVAPRDGRFEGNWELSAARAIAVVKLFATEHAVAPGRLSVGGYAEHRPLVPHAVRGAGDINRRVDIVVNPLEPAPAAPMPEIPAPAASATPDAATAAPAPSPSPSASGPH